MKIIRIEANLDAVTRTWLLEKHNDASFFLDENCLLNETGNFILFLMLMEFLMKIKSMQTQNINWAFLSDDEYTQPIFHGAVLKPWGVWRLFRIKANGDIQTVPTRIQTLPSEYLIQRYSTNKRTCLDRNRKL